MALSTFLRCENVKPCRDCYLICRKSIQCFILAGNFFKIKDRLLYYLQNMCYCKNSLKTSLINDLQSKSIIIQLRVLGLIRITGPWMKILYSNSECKANLEMVPMIKMCTMTLRDLIRKPTFFLTAISKVLGEKLSEEDETLLCLQAKLSSDEESQFNEVMSLAVRSPLEVLEHQLEPYLHGSLNNPSNDMLVRSQAAPVHNMLSERTPVSFLSLITWGNLIFNLFETFKRTSRNLV